MKLTSNDVQVILLYVNCATVEYQVVQPFRLPKLTPNDVPYMNSYHKHK